MKKDFNTILNVVIPFKSGLFFESGQKIAYGDINIACRNPF